MYIHKIGHVLKKSITGVRNYHSSIYWTKNNSNIYKIYIKENYLNIIEDINVTKETFIEQNDKLFTINYDNNFVSFYSPFDGKIISKNMQNCNFLYCKYNMKPFCILKIEPYVFDNNYVIITDNIFNVNEIYEKQYVY